MKKLFAFMLTLALTLGVGSAALASWAATGAGSAVAVAGVLLPGASPAITDATRLPTEGTAAVSLSWAPSQNATGFEVRRTASVGGAVQVIGSECDATVPAPVAGEVGCSETATPEGRWRYEQRVRVGQHWVGPWSMPSDEVAIVPAAPSGVSATSSSETQIRLSWTNNSTTADTVRVERSVDGHGGWTQVADVVTSSAEHLDEGVACASTHYYRLRSHSSVHLLTGEYSDVVHATSGACARSRARIAAMDNISTEGNGTNWRPAVRLTVLDELDAPVVGATIAGDFIWSNGSSQGRSCITSANGSCDIQAHEDSNRATATFEVTSRSHDGYDWDTSEAVVQLDAR